jgi:hypothetical protein
MTDRAEEVMSKTFRLIVSTSIEVGVNHGDTLSEIQQRVQEQVNNMYARMAREDDIRIVLQHQCAVVETP